MLCALQVGSDMNLRYHGRFLLPLLFDTEYTSIWDDDVDPANDWLEHSALPHSVMAILTNALHLITFSIAALLSWRSCSGRRDSPEIVFYRCYEFAFELSLQLSIFTLSYIGFCKGKFWRYRNFEKAW